MLTIATLVPAYNAALHILQALDSVAAQTRLPDEIVVVDDGSTDDTADIVTRWAAQHPHLQLQLIHQPNGGASAARNTAILAASAELIAFLDADDAFEPDHLARLSSRLISHPELIVIFGQASVYEHGQLVSTNQLAGKPIEHLVYDQQSDGVRILGDGFWEALIHGNFIPTCSSMTYRNLAIEVGLFDTSLATSEDRDFWLHLSRKGAFGYFPEPVARIHRHTTNITSDANDSLVQRNALDVVKKQLDNSVQLTLTESELAATNTALGGAAKILLYYASRRGIAAYQAELHHLGQVIPKHSKPSARGWLRAILASLRGRMPMNQNNDTV